MKDVAEFRITRISSTAVSSNNYVSTENMQQNFEGVTSAQNVPVCGNIIKFSREDILISNIRPYLKKIWFADRDGGCSADVMVLKCSNKLNKRFLYYALANNRFISHVMAGAKGVKMPRGDKEQILNFPIGTPSLAEQNRISELLSLLDQRISIQNKVIEKYESLIKALYKNLIPRDVNKTAELGTFVQICKGKQLNGEFLSDDGKYYVMNGGITPSGYYDDYNTPAGTISISEGGNSCGFVQFNEMPFWSGGHCYTLLKTDDERIQYKFLYHFLKSKQDDIMALRIGSGLPNIQKKDIRIYPVPILPYYYQIAITKILDAVCQHIEIERAILEGVTLQKQYLLQTLFI